MDPDTGATVALRSIKKVPDASELFGENYEVTFDIRSGGIEGTVAVPIPMRDGSDTETVLQARQALHLAFTQLAAEAINVPAARNRPQGVDAEE